MLVVTLLAPLAAIPDQAAAATQIEVKETVSFRDKPSTSSEVIRYLKSGEQLVVLSEPNSYWYEVLADDGTSGYVSSSSQYITAAVADEDARAVASASANASSNASASASASSKKGEIVASVAFRTSPSTGASRIRYLSRGETVTVLSQPNSYWYQVRDSRGTTGYVSSQSQYIRVSGGTVAPPTSGSSQSSKVEKVINVGMSFLGTPYQYGSNRNSTRYFDCSAFVRRAFQNALNVTLPADSRGQGNYVKNKGNAKSNWRQLQRGDLMFFMSYRGTSASSYSGVNKSKATITHVGIYLGDGKVLHTYSKESGGVRTDSIVGKHWEHRFLFGGSAL
ncbi:hypothetical protein PA598K_03723 [Paenibacillus sp. 598K]|nr:hypothetical protein PA598K_03723 [Paenibacillus sp. 598K]